MPDATIPYETKFEDGSNITDYLAIGIAEGFEESNEPIDVIRAWSYICGKGLWKELQGYFGMSVNNLIESKVLDIEGRINWDKYNELIGV
jgi:hypothetical protein